MQGIPRTNADLAAIGRLGGATIAKHYAGMIPRIVLLIAALAAAPAVAAAADAVRAPDDVTSRFRLNSVVPGPAPAGPRMNYVRQPRIEGVAKTSVESRFGVRDAATGEAGFLCGLLPHPDTSGAAAAYGHDPDGRFVGAKLRLAF